jgi:uncharacterized protein (DUF2267 family)
MQYDEFIGHVHNRAQMASREEAVRAIHATLQTLGERLAGGEAGNLAAQLPPEIGTYLRMGGDGTQSFGLKEFLRRVAEREQVDPSDATHHTRVVMEVLSEAVTPGELGDVRAQLPDEYNPLFEAGSTGTMNKP